MRLNRVGNFVAVAGAATAFSVLPMASAEATVGDRCGPVFLEGESQVSPKLSEAIGGLALQGVNAHVHLLQGAEAHGMTTDAGFDRYVNGVAEECGWGVSDVLATYVAYTPPEKAEYGVNNGVLDVNRADVVKYSWLSDSTVTGVRKQFGRNLADGSTGIQEDLAGVVRGIHIAHQQAAERTDKKPAVDIDMPWGQITKVGTPILALGSLGGFGAVSIRRRREFVGRREGLLEDIEAAVAKMNQVRDGASFVSGATNVEDPGLSPLWREAGDLARLTVEFNAARQAIGKVPLSFFWPNPRSLGSAAATVDRLCTQFVPEVAEYVRVRKDVEQDLAEGPGRVQKLKDLLQAAFGAKGTLAEGGWDVAVLEIKYTELFAQIGTLEERLGKDAIGASDDAEHLIPEVAKYVADTSATALEARFKEALTAHEVRADAIKTVTAEIAAAKKVLEIMSKGSQDYSAKPYHQSCYEDIKNKPGKIDTLFDQLSAIQVRAQEVTGQKSVAAVEQAEKLRDDFTQTMLAARDEMQQVHDRLALLEDLKMSLPSDAEQLLQLLAQHEGDAKEWGTDIDAAAFEGLSDTRTLIDQVKIDLGAQQPKYLDIRDSYASAANNVAKAYRHVTEQRAEATSLRTSIGEEWADVEASLRALRDYVSSNYDTLGISTDFAVRAPDTAGNRAELRAILNRLEEVDTQIDSRLREAKEKVRQAEAAREAERLRQEAARRAQASAAVSSSSYSSSGRSSSRGSV